MSTDWICDLDEAERDDLLALLAAATRIVVDDAAVARGEDPPGLEAPYDLIPPGTDERYPNGVRIERIEAVRTHPTTGLHAVAACAHTRALPASLSPTQKLALNAGDPGAFGRLNAAVQRAQSLPEGWKVPGEELSVVVGKPLIKVPG
jgi:hypothetical protein